MATPDEREALLAACFETVLEDELGEEFEELRVDVPLLADALLVQLYNRLDNIPAEVPVANALRYGLIPVVTNVEDRGIQVHVRWPAGETAYRSTYPETD